MTPDHRTITERRPRAWTWSIRLVVLLPLAVIAWVGDRADAAYWWVESNVR